MKVYKGETTEPIIGDPDAVFFDEVQSRKLGDHAAHALERALNAEIERLLTEKAEALEDVSDTRIDRDEARERADRLEAKCAALEAENKRAFAMVETHRKERDAERTRANMNGVQLRAQELLLAERDAAREEANALRGQLRTALQVVHDLAYNGRRFRVEGRDIAFDANARRMNVTMHVSDSGAWVGETEVTLCVRDANQVAQKVSP